MRRDPSKPSQLFISHRHDDKPIADLLRAWIGQWTAGRVNVFQSSSFAHGPKIGMSLSKELLDNLWQTDVLLLLYTLPDHDWSYCMWECGVATDPASPDTRVVVLQFSDDAPAPFEDQVRVNVRSKESLNQFVNQFLTDAKFFPGMSGAITGYGAASSQVLSAGEALFESLRKIPATRLEKIDEWPAWPFLRLQMSLDTAKEVACAGSEAAHSLIRESTEIAHSDWVACNLFGVPKIASHATLGWLCGRWQEQFPGGDAAWVDSLTRQIHLAVQWQFPRCEGQLLRGQQSKDNEWYSPVVAWVKKIPYRNAMEFEVYFLPFACCSEDSFIRIAKPIAS